MIRIGAAGAYGHALRPINGHDYAAQVQPAQINGNLWLQLQGADGQLEPVWNLFTEIVALCHEGV